MRDCAYTVYRSRDINVNTLVLQAAIRQNKLDFLDTLDFTEIDVESLSEEDRNVVLRHHCGKGTRTPSGRTPRGSGAAILHGTPRVGDVGTTKESRTQRDL